MPGLVRAVRAREPIQHPQYAPTKPLLALRALLHCVDMTMNEYQDIIRETSEWIRDAGRIALERFGRAVAERKSDRSIVTDADHAVQALLLDAIAHRYPADAVIT